MWWGSSGRSSYFWGGALVVVGTLLLLGNLGLLNDINWDYVWPVLLIAFGVWLIAARALQRGARSSGGPATADRSTPPEPPTKVEENQ
jgi:hypothetical protein